MSVNTMLFLTLTTVDVETCQVNDIIIVASICHGESTLTSSLNQPTRRITAKSVASIPQT